jgi:hypothetical protein
MQWLRTCTLTDKLWTSGRFRRNGSANFFKARKQVAIEETRVMIKRNLQRIPTQAVLAVAFIAMAGSLAWAGSSRSSCCSCYCQGIDIKGCLSNCGGCSSSCCCVINTKTCCYTGCCRCKVKNCCCKAECYKNCCFLQNRCYSCCSSVYTCDHSGCCCYTCCGTYCCSGGGGGAA